MRGFSPKWLVLFSFLGMAVVVRCRKYFIPDEQLNWYDAKTFCLDLEMNLVTINSQQKQEDLAQFIRSSNIFNPNRLYVWTGANDLAQEGRFVWDATGEPLSYTNWRFRMPDNSWNNEDCVHLYTDRFDYFEWNDLGCTATMYFVCE